jgi:hypothetical protein
VAPLVSASYGAPLHVCSSYISWRPLGGAKTDVRTAPSAPKQPTIPLWLHRVFGTTRPDRLHPRAEAHPTRGASGSFTPSAPKVIHPHFWHRRPAPFDWVVPAQQNSHNPSSISVFIKSPLQNFLRRSEAARGTKPMLTVKIRQPSHEFTFGVGISFIPYPLVLTPVV